MYTVHLDGNKFKFLSLELDFQTLLNAYAQHLISIPPGSIKANFKNPCFFVMFMVAVSTIV